MDVSRTTAAVAILIATLGLVTLRVWPAWTQPRIPDTVTFYVVAPAGEDVSYGIADAGIHEAGLAMEWIEAQTGQTFSRGPDFAQIVHLNLPAAAYMGDAERAFELILDDVLATVRTEGVFPVVMADLQTHPGGAALWTCGLGSPFGLVMFIDNCPDRRMSTTSVWGSAASVTIAHGFVHGLGAVANCALHASGDGHVNDDPADILYVSSSAQSAGDYVLDQGRDDYFAHGMVGCPDIADSPLWTS